jgi:hypothetical protein
VNWPCSDQGSACSKKARAISVYDYDDHRTPGWSIDRPVVGASGRARGDPVGGGDVPSLFNSNPSRQVDQTSGVAIMGMFGIPASDLARARVSDHAPDERTWKADLVRCAALHCIASIPEERR